MSRILLDVLGTTHTHIYLLLLILCKYAS